eukprot:CAMPEP_0202975324 /NCGR_PEP_ID=MMETSP1396-20130829/68148_1 /ASSEMBLY_ACC=CAM_ASM_000872 /TAXON_ID= /ORGANISM="Pseudokeronopsis sp., Strain Brazil" /LENGTH=74 /DNA_ID=CAMNT_0049710723 /DNA_START=206 /DNA_END=430 /DNA_ORIENTATION=+
MRLVGEEVVEGWAGGVGDYLGVSGFEGRFQPLAEADPLLVAALLEEAKGLVQVGAGLPKYHFGLSTTVQVELSL